MGTQGDGDTGPLCWALLGQEESEGLQAEQGLAMDFRAVLHSSSPTLFQEQIKSSPFRKLKNDFK